jgi:hypothetical protein
MRKTVNTLALLLLVAAFGHCKKSDSPAPGNLSSVNGTWQTTVWGGSSDTAAVTISSSTATGLMSFISSGAAALTNFSVGDSIFSNIMATGTTTFSMRGMYRFKDNNSVWQVGHANGTLTLENSSTLLAHYSTDAGTGITPPDYYWTKQ